MKVGRTRDQQDQLRSAGERPLVSLAVVLGCLFHAIMAHNNQLFFRSLVGNSDTSHHVGQTRAIFYKDYQLLGHICV